MDVRLPDGTIIKNVPEGTTQAELMARVEKLRAATKPIEQKPYKADAAEKFAGSVPGRFLLGAGQLIAGPFQLGANIGDKIAEVAGFDPVVGKAVNQWQQRIEEMKRRGMEAHGTEGFDLAGLAGTVAGGAGALKNIPQATTTLGKIGQGSLIGSVFGAATPVTEVDNDFFSTKGAQIGSGAVLGAAIPTGAATGRGIGTAVRDVADLVLPKGAERIATRYQRGIVGGAPERQKVIEALTGTPELVSGSRPTAAQALAGVPQGSPITAHQAMVARTPGGVSARFGERAIDQRTARTAAMDALEEATAPLRRAALDAANANGVTTTAVTSKIDAIASQPGLRASDIVRKTLASIKDKISTVSDDTGKINADDLYTIRKEIGNTIKTHAKETANWDKRLAAGLQRDVQKAIDDAIEDAGGAGWKNYLTQYSVGRQAIQADIDRAKSALRPEQRTSLRGGQNVAEETRAHIPQLLSRPAMIANAVMRRMGYAVEPRIDEILSQRYLEPKVLADALQDMPSSKYRDIIKALTQQYGRAIAIGGPTTLAAEQQ